MADLFLGIKSVVFFCVCVYGQFITLGSTQKFGGQSKNIHARVRGSKKYNIIYIDL